MPEPIRLPDSVADCHQVIRRLHNRVLELEAQPPTERTPSTYADDIDAIVHHPWIMQIAQARGVAA